MDTANRNIRFSVPKGRAAFLALVAFVFAAAGGVYVVNVVQAGNLGDNPSNLIFAIIVCLAAALCLLGGISMLIALVSSRAALVIDSHGILDATTLFGAGLIRWEEIAGLAEYRVLMQRYLGIIPRDLGTLLSRRWLLPKAAMMINAWTSPAAINIPEALLPVSAEELLRSVRTNFSPELQRYRIWVQITAEERSQRSAP